MLHKSPQEKGFLFLRGRKIEWEIPGPICAWRTRQYLGRLIHGGTVVAQQRSNFDSLLCRNNIYCPWSYSTFLYEIQNTFLFRRRKLKLFCCESWWNCWIPKEYWSLNRPSPLYSRDIDLSHRIPWLRPIAEKSGITSIKSCVILSPHMFFLRASPNRSKRLISQTDR